MAVKWAFYTVDAETRHGYSAELEWDIANARHAAIGWHDTKKAALAELRDYTGIEDVKADVYYPVRGLDNTCENNPYLRRHWVMVRRIEFGASLAP